MGGGPGSWDPIPYLASLIDGLRQVALQDSQDSFLLRLGDLLAGPYSALRGGLLLDEPGRESISTEAALREVLSAVAGSPVSHDDLDLLLSHFYDEALGSPDRVHWRSAELRAAADRLAAATRPPGADVHPVLERPASRTDGTGVD
jgi:hypothetical protein